MCDEILTKLILHPSELRMSKESEIYKKSVIDIHIKFDEEKEKEFRAILGEKFGLRPACIKNVPDILDKKGILEKDFEKRSTEVKKFRKQSQSALISPLLNMALVKKTKKFLISKKVGLFQSFEIRMIAFICPFCFYRDFMSKRASI